jgi:hypothetical protein
MSYSADGVLIDGTGQKTAITAIGSKADRSRGVDVPPRSPKSGDPSTALRAGYGAPDISYCAGRGFRATRRRIALAPPHDPALLVQSINNCVDRFAVKVRLPPLKQQNSEVPHRNNEQAASPLPVRFR